MAGSYSSQTNPGMMLPTTSVWDVSEVFAIESLSPQLRELLVRLYQNLNNMSLAVNLKDTGYYSNQEFLNSQVFFPNPNNPPSTTSVFRQVFRTTVNFGTLPDTMTLSVPHNIDVNEAYSFTRIYGASTNSTATSFIPLPYASAVPTDIVELNADTTNINITTSDDWTDYITTYVILEYVKQ